MSTSLSNMKPLFILQFEYLFLYSDNLTKHAHHVHELTIKCMPHGPIFGSCLVFVPLVRRGRHFP